jgi:hypothetical protein
MNLGTNSPSTISIIERIESAVDDSIRANVFPATIQVAAEHLQVDCELLAVESIACAFAQLDVSNESWQSAPLEQVKRIAETLAGRLSYLLEPIRTVEADADTCTVQMRSLPPRKAEDGTRTYYELQVRGGGKLSLCRYVKEPDQSRRTIPVQVTREVFSRLVADFVDAAAGTAKKASAA